MNARMTVDARLTLRRLDVLRHRRESRRGVGRRKVAVQAYRVHIGLSEQLGIRSPVREVAGAATFGLNRSVLVNEGSGRRRVAFSAIHELP